MILLSKTLTVTRCAEKERLRKRLMNHPAMVSLIRLRSSFKASLVMMMMMMEAMRAMMSEILIGIYLSHNDS